MKVTDLSIEELKVLIGEVVEEKLQEILGDPDWSLELKADVKERLKKSLADLNGGKRGIPFEEAAQRLGFGNG